MTQPTNMDKHVRPCDRCGEDIRWGTMPSGRRAPFAPQPSWRSHFADCREAVERQAKPQKAEKPPIQFGPEVTDEEKEALEAKIREALG